MKTNFLKFALALTVIAGVYVTKALASEAAKPNCVMAENVCYVLEGPDGTLLPKLGVLVYPAN